MPFKYYVNYCAVWLLSMSSRQSKIAYFAPGACCVVADWCRHLANSTESNIVFDSVALATLCKHDVIYKTGSTYRIALWSEEDRATPIQVTCIENFVKFG